MQVKYSIFYLMVLLVLVSCSNEPDPTPEPITKADIIGSVNLYNEGTTQIANSNMTVKLEGTIPVISAKTDTDGNFTLVDVPFATYTLIYEKSGFGTYKRFNIIHENTGSSTRVIGAPSLGEVSTTQVTGLEANINANNVIISIFTDPAGSNGNARYIRYFLSSSSNVSNEDYTFYSPGLISLINPYELTLSQNDLSNAGFSSGETVYVKAYGDSFWSNEYDDPDLSRKVFPNLNMTSANSVSFIVP